MNEYPLLSVIVPVYNCEKYLSRTLNSLLKQTYKNIEIILVNDGSKGNFNETVAPYQQSNTKIIIVNHEQNLGLFRARISGVQASNGQYITFCDGDDEVSLDYYRKLINKAIETSSDMVIGDWAYKYENGNIEYCNLDPILNDNILLNNEEVLDYFMEQEGLSFSYYVVWNKIYSKNLWDKCEENLLKFSLKNKKLTMTEDIAFSSMFWTNANKVCNVHNIFYFYNQHIDQSTKHITNIEIYEKNIKDVANVFKFFKKNIIENSNKEKYNKNLYNWESLFVRYWYDNIGKLNDQKAAKNILNKYFPNFTLENTTNNDYFFYSQKTSLLPQFKWLEDIKETIVNKECEYVSFDIFDTLICRPFLKPDDLFYFITDDFNKLVNPLTFLDFHKIRWEAENECRKLLKYKSNYEDINIDEIYNFISHHYKINKDNIEKIKNIELRLESYFCQRRELGYDLYNLAVYYNKKIICISDMYLRKDFINTILNKNGYIDHIDIFISSEERALKGTGNLYKKVIKKIKLKSKQKLVHIGDNWHSDIIQAKNIGIKIGHLPNPVERLLGNNGGTYSGNFLKKLCNHNKHLFNFNNAIENFLGIRCMLGLIAIKLFDNNILSFNLHSDINSNPIFFGYFIFGMHLYAITDWLIENNKNNKNNIHFIARDGYLPKMAYDIMSDPNINSKSNYLYLSRKATLPLLLENTIDIFSFKNFIRYQVMSPIKIKELLSAIIRIDNETFFDLCEKNLLNPYNNFQNQNLFENFLKEFFIHIVDKNKLNSYKKRILNFFSTIIFSGDAFFDLGYSGRNEELLSKILKINLTSYYIHTNTDIVQSRIKKSNFDIKCFYGHTPLMYVVLREHLFSKLSPSCIGYEIKNDNVTPMFEEYHIPFQTKFITKRIQENAIKFIEDMNNVFGKFKDTIYYKKIDASVPFEFFLHYCNAFDKNMFSSIVFEDDLYGGENISLVEFWYNLQIKNNLHLENNESQKCLTCDHVVWKERAEILHKSKWFILGKKLGIIKFNWKN